MPSRVVRTSSAHLTESASLAVAVRTARSVESASSLRRCAALKPENQRRQRRTVRLVGGTSILTVGVGGPARREHSRWPGATPRVSRNQICSINNIIYRIFYRCGLYHTFFFNWA